MRNQRIVEALEALARHDEGREAAPEVEDRVLRAFRARSFNANRQRTRARLVRTGWILAASAAGVIVGMALMAGIQFRVFSPQTASTLHPQTPATANQKSAKQSGPVAPIVATLIPEQDLSRSVRASRKTVLSAHLAQQVKIAEPALQPTQTPTAETREPESRQQETRQSVEIVTGFFPLLDSALPFERGELLRVTLPARTVRSMGIPVNEDRLGDEIHADVLVGEEGLPRAIRFVRFDLK